jgi:hypothetical protein
MIVPVAVRSFAAVVGGTLVFTAWANVIGTLIVPRRGSGFIRWTERIVDQAFWAFIVAVRASSSYERREQLLRPQGATIVIVQFLVWLGCSFIGFTLLLWPFVTGGITQAFAVAGGSMTTLGFSPSAGAIPPAIVYVASASGLVIIAPQIAYLPSLYAAYDRRETEVTLLDDRAGVPAWGPELLARTQYELVSGLSTLDTLPDLYAQWERWAADVADSHSAYLPLVRFRSSRPLTSWVIALLAVLDSAALHLALSPSSAPVVPARLCLRRGFLCFRQLARAMHFDVPDYPDPDAGISLTYQEFLGGVARLRMVGFPIERDPADAWPDFVGWRVNYEQAAYALAFAVDAVPALWSGPRRRSPSGIPPIPPPLGRMPSSLDPPVN